MVVILPIGVPILEPITFNGAQAILVKDIFLGIAKTMVIEIYMHGHQVLELSLYFKIQKKPLGFGIMVRFIAMGIHIFALSMEN